MNFDATARLATEKQGMSTCLPLVSSADDERTAMCTTEFDWEDAKENECVLVAAPARKIALFANSIGDISLVVSADGQEVLTSIDPDEAIRLIGMLSSAVDQAMPEHRRRCAEYSAFVAIHKASHGDSDHA